MKKMILLIRTGLFLWLAGLLMSCQKPVDKGVYYDIIPSDVKTVIALNVNQLAEKAGLEDILQNRFFHMADRNSELIRKLEQICQDSRKSGLELSENIYLFQGKENNGVFGCVAKVENISKLKEVFKSMEKEAVCTPLVSSGDFYETVMEGELFCKFNDSFFLGVRTENPEVSREYAHTLIEQKGKGQITAKEGFQQMVKATDDISMLVFMEQILHMASAEKDGNFPDMNFLIGINFKDGEIQMTTKMLADDPAALASLEKENYLGKTSTIFMEYYPASTLVYTGFHVIGEKLNKMLEQQQRGWLLNGTDKAEIEKSLTAFNGEFSFGVTQLSALGIPSVLAYAEVSNAYPLETFITFLRTQMGNLGELKKKGKNAYEFTITALPVYTFYLGIKDDHLLYFTNDTELYHTLAQKPQEPLSTTPFASGLKKAAYGGVLLNIEAFTQSPVLQLSLGQMLGVQQGKAVMEGLKEFTYAEFLYPTLTECVFHIYMKNKTQNSLKTLVQMGKQ